MRCISRVILLVTACLFCSRLVLAQTGAEKITDLSEFVVHQLRLKPLDMLDSVMAHRPQNYPAYLYYGGRMDASITASGSGDTLFYASRPVWLERGKYGVYSVYGRPGDTGRQLVNRAAPVQTDRVITIRTYPAAHGLGTLLQTLRDRLKKAEAFYGTSFRDSQRVLHIIAPVSASPGNWLTRLVASPFSADTVIAYLSLEIGQDDWSLLRQEWISLSTDAATAQRFKAARKYTELTRLLQGALRQQGLRYIRAAHSFAALPGGKGYRPALNEFEDNLYNLSKKMPQRGENAEASVFRMRLLVGEPVAQLPDEELREAKSGDFVMSENEGAAMGP